MFISKKILFWLILVIIGLTSAGVLIIQRDSTYKYKQGGSTEADTAVSTALKLFKEQAKELDLESGPCLTNDLIPNWVADIVHKPRQTVDDLPENQCQAFIEGRAKHFVELDKSGNIINVK